MPKLRTIIGHQKQIEELRADITAQNISHAYLFSGPRHLGKMSTARQFAFELLSADATDDESLVVKKDIERLLHADLTVLDQLWIEGVSDDWDVLAKYSNAPQVHRSKAPAAKTDSISIEDVRALQERLYDTGVGEHRCCIIRSMERMKAEAANAFLKILEEPPKGLVFILTTQSLQTLLPTIISRTRVMQFNRLSHKEMSSLVSDSSEDDAAFILSIAQGAPGVAIQLNADPDLLRTHKTIHAQAHSFWRTHSQREKLQLLTPLHKRGIDADRMLLHLGLTLREQPKKITLESVSAFHQMTRDFRTNAHRELLADKFAYQVSS